MLEVYHYLDEPQLHNNIYQAAKMLNVFAKSPGQVSF